MATPGQTAFFGLVFMIIGFLVAARRSALDRLQSRVAKRLLGHRVSRRVDTSGVQRLNVGIQGGIGLIMGVLGLLLFGVGVSRLL